MYLSKPKQAFILLLLLSITFFIYKLSRKPMVEIQSETDSITIIGSLGYINLFIFLETLCDKKTELRKD
jgi:hypothetical protein